MTASPFRRPAAVVRPAAFVLLAAFAAAGCAGGPHPYDEAGGLSPRLIRTAYFDDGKALFVGLDVTAAVAVDAEKTLPLALVLANRGPSGAAFDRESFRLEDDGGRTFPLLSYEEFRALSRATSLDRRASEKFYEAAAQRLGPAAGGANPTIRAVPFFGVETARRDRVDIAPAEWARGMLYFPRPAGDLAGRVFSLLVRPIGAAETIVVKFRCA
ncbi:MAG: hypothetical protein ABFD84_14445 [Candidatus Polarisedimenticolia bacterium]|nr:hypothetical protein [bacterium]